MTQKSKLLKEHTLRQYAGWTANSNVPQRYIRYFGNEASESLLEARQIEALIKKQEQFEQLIQSLIDSGKLRPIPNSA